MDYGRIAPGDGAGASIVPLMRAALYAYAAAGRRVDGFTLLLAALSVLGAGLVLAREVNYGPALHWDAVAYISTARNLLDGQGFIGFNDDWRYFNWPPLYPLLLAALSFGIFDPYVVAGPLNAIIFGLTIFAAGVCLRGRVRNGLLLVWACAAVALSLPLATMAYEIQSEPLFMLCLTVSLLHSVRYFDEGRRSALIWAAVFAALALLTRYAGITLLLTMLPLLVFQRETAIREKAGRTGLYLLIALLPVAVWLLRNYLTFGAIRNLGGHTPQNLWQTLQQYLGELSGWVFLSALPGGFGVAAMALMAALLAALALVVAAAAIRFLFYPKASRDSNDRGRWIGCGVIGGFGLIYCVFVVSAVAREGFEGGSQRYLSPAYVPLALATALALDGLLAGSAKESGRPAVAGRLFNRTSILKWGG